MLRCCDIPENPYRAPLVSDPRDLMPPHPIPMGGQSCHGRSNRFQHSREVLQDRRRGTLDGLPQQRTLRSSRFMTYKYREDDQGLVNVPMFHITHLLGI